MSNDLGLINLRAQMLALRTKKERLTFIYKAVNSGASYPTFETLISLLDKGLK